MYSHDYNSKPEVRAKTQAWKDSHKEERREYNLKRLYGVDMAMYNKMLAEQNGVCAICLLPPPATNRQNKVLHVDHDHETGKVRALLCVTCNTAIGKFTAEGLDRAAAYLRKHGK